MIVCLTRDLARAAARDAGNRNMRAAGRTMWSEADWNAACNEYERLLELYQPLFEDEKEPNE